MKQLKFFSVQPDDTRFWWEVLIQLNNFRQYGYSQYANVLVYIPIFRKEQGLNPLWKIAEEWFPETNFFYYYGDEGIDVITRKFNYIPILRPFCLAKHFKLFPELKNDAIFYHDSDVVFTKKLDFSPFIDDRINYLSDTSSYLGATYFKNKEALYPEILAFPTERDALGEMASICDITREICEQNEKGAGGAQYILKNIDGTFWTDVLDAAVMIRNHLSNFNKKYMKGNTPQEKENIGYQSWCADMWAILHILWRNKQVTVCPTELDFAWATDDISRWEECYLMHNAGITSSEKLRKKIDKTEIDCPAFYKGKYVNNSSTPFHDIQYLQQITNNQISSQFCTSKYVQEILKTIDNANKSEFKLLR